MLLEKRKKDFRFDSMLWQIPSYEDVQHIIYSNNISTAKEYRIYRKDHPGLGLPFYPDRIYNKEWSGWDSFFGSKFIVEESDFPIKLHYSDLREKYLAMGLPSSDPYLDSFTNYEGEWLRWGFFLLDPEITSEEGEWLDLNFFLSDSVTDTETLLLDQGDMLLQRDRKLLSYEQVQKVNQEQGLFTTRQYHEYRKSHPKLGLPSNPSIFYTREWQGWPKFLAPKLSRLLPYKEAWEIVQKNNISTTKQYHEYRKSHTELSLPSKPNIFYKREWQGWPKFLAPKLSRLLSYKEVWEIVQKNNISTTKQYHEYRKSYPELGLPSNPSIFYKREWQGWPEFFAPSTSTKPPKFLSGFSPLDHKAHMELKSPHVPNKKSKGK